MRSVFGGLEGVLGTGNVEVFRVEEQKQKLTVQQLFKPLTKHRQQSTSHTNGFVSKQFLTH